MVVMRGEITDEAWGQVAPLLPENDRRAGGGATTARW